VSEPELTNERPHPSEGFASRTKARLAELEQERAAGPSRLRLRVGICLGSGVALLVLAALSLAGFGPLGS
jgi:hypothetical protein